MTSMRGAQLEAARATIEFELGELRLERIVAVTLRGNRASRHVLEKCGMTVFGGIDLYGHAQVEYAIAR